MRRLEGRPGGRGRPSPAAYSYSPGAAPLRAEEAPLAGPDAQPPGVNAAAGAARGDPPPGPDAAAPDAGGQGVLESLRLARRAAMETRHGSAAAIFRSHVARGGFDGVKGVFLGDAVPEARLRRAGRLYGMGADLDGALVLVDTTLLGGGGKGLALTPADICSRGPDVRHGAPWRLNLERVYGSAALGRGLYINGRPFARFRRGQEKAALATARLALELAAFRRGGAEAAMGRSLAPDCARPAPGDVISPEDLLLERLETILGGMPGAYVKPSFPPYCLAWLLARHAPDVDPADVLLLVGFRTVFGRVPGLLVTRRAVHGPERGTGRTVAVPLAKGVQASPRSMGLEVGGRYLGPFAIIKFQSAVLAAAVMFLADSVRDGPAPPRP